MTLIEHSRSLLEYADRVLTMKKRETSLFPVPIWMGMVSTTW